MSRAKVRQRAERAGQVQQDMSRPAAPVARPPAFADLPLLQDAAVQLRSYSDQAWNVYGAVYPQLEQLIARIEHRLGLPLSSHQQVRDEEALARWRALHTTPQPTGTGRPTDEQQRTAAR